MENNNINDNGFSLISVLLIVVVTSIISALTAGVIIYNNNKITSNVSYSDLANDESLNQFLEVYANITSEYYEGVDKSELLEKAISAMMSSLSDDYTTYLNDEATDDLLSSLAGKYDGIGISINNADKSITKVYNDTPASKAGLQANDIIIGFNNEDVSSLLAEDIVAKIKNEKGDFTLTIKRDDQILDFTLSNESIIKPSIDYNFIPDTKIGYIAISAFSETLEYQVHQALADLENNGMTSLIIDLRDNTGGFLDAAHNVASIFLPKGNIIYSLNEKGKITNYKDETSEKKNYKIVVLVNESTASASEILTAALKEGYGATVVGETTYGKGKVQQTMKLNNGSMVKYTSAYWLTPNGTCIDKVGIIPDYQIENIPIVDNENPTAEEITDMQLEKAKELLQ